jgi:hypothetical protein
LLFYHGGKRGAEDVGDAHDIEPAAPAALVQSVALPEAEPGSAAGEVAPVPPDALDHGFWDAFTGSRLWDGFFFTLTRATRGPSTSSTRKQRQLTELVDSRQLVVKTAALEEALDEWSASQLRRVQSSHSAIILASEEGLSLSRTTPMPSS